jgi:hypothetical protein
MAAAYSGTERSIRELNDKGPDRRGPGRSIPGPCFHRVNACTSVCPGTC